MSVFGDKTQGQYRNTIFDDSQKYIELADYENALNNLLQVCYLDLYSDSIQNLDNEMFELLYSEYENRKDCLADQIMLVPRVIINIDNLIKKLNITVVELERLFIKVIDKLPVKNSIYTNQEVWEYIKNELEAI